MVIFWNIDMPIYVYQCNACGERLEKLQKISDPVLVDCPFCGQPALQKMVTAAGFRLKGSGWYETDFKTEGKRNLAGDQETADKKADSKDNADSKSPDKKADHKADNKADNKASKPASDSKAKPKTGDKGKTETRSST